MSKVNTNEKFLFDICMLNGRARRFFWPTNLIVNLSFGHEFVDL